MSRAFLRGVAFIYVGAGSNGGLATPFVPVLVSGLRLPSEKSAAAKAPAAAMLAAAEASCPRRTLLLR